MTRGTVLLVDDNEQQRHAFTLCLEDLLQGTDLTVEAIAPLKDLQAYARRLDDGKVVALILDQKMEDGGVNYTGTALSSQLRAFAPKLPIFILSSFTKSPALFDDGIGDVEDVISKDDLAKPTEKNAQVFKARFLRHLDGFVSIRSERGERYHDLLVKSLRDGLAPDEEAELGFLETERLLPQQAKELGDIKTLREVLANLSERLHSTKLSTD